MTKRIWHIAAMVAIATVAAPVGADHAEGVISGRVTDGEGKPLRGIMVTATDHEAEKTITVYTQKDGTYKIGGLAARDHELRARWQGHEDEYKDVSAKKIGSKDLDFRMMPAEEPDMQRTADQLISLLKFPNEDDLVNFRMQCTYCHQVGTLGFRTPEEPVDWEVMVTRMDGFAGLFDHTKSTLVDLLVNTYTGEAMEKWPAYTPKEAPDGEVLNATVTEWMMGDEENAMIHDLEVGPGDWHYIVDMIGDAVIAVNQVTNERKVHTVPGGKEYHSDDVPRKGPHSIEIDTEGGLWMTLALSGEMAKLDPESGEWTVVKSSENGRRGFYPHTLRIDQKGFVWYTDAGMNSVFKLDPNAISEDKRGNQVAAIKRYKLEAPTQEAEAINASRARIRGEGGAIVPYGIDVAPNGHIWYSKLNGQRVGRINPETDEITEWDPPVHGPRRLHVAPNGIVWIPGFGTGDLCSYDPEKDEWKVYPLPSDGNALPYALNIHPTTGDVWICGTGLDTMMKFDPKTETVTSFPMPTRVTYTREIEFDAAGNIWTCNSNYPVRHIENNRGTIIRIEMN